MCGCMCTSAPTSQLLLRFTSNVSMEMEIGKAVLVMCVEYDSELCVSKLHYAVRSTALPLFVLVNVKCQVCTACTAVYRVINLKR